MGSMQMLSKMRKEKMKEAIEKADLTDWLIWIRNADKSDWKQKTSR